MTMHVIGTYSYFVYLVHMKIFDQINASLGTCFAEYIFFNYKKDRII